MGRFPLSGTLVMGALAGLALLPAGPADAKQRQTGCRIDDGMTVAKHGGRSLIVADVGEDDGLYGAPQAVFACRSAKARPVRISSWPAGTSIAIRKVRWTARYVAYSQFGSDDQCSKYSGVGTSECDYAVGGSYDLRTGRRRAAYDASADVATTVLAPQGWVAVLSHPDAAGQRTLSGADGQGQRVLATGPIDLRSLRFRGSELRWTAAGQEQHAALGSG